MNWQRKLYRASVLSLSLFLTRYRNKNVPRKYVDILYREKKERDRDK